MAGRPTKRQRLNPFIDIEAVGEEEDSDEETEGASSSSEFPAPTHDIVMPDVSQDDVSQDEADLDVSSLALLQNGMHGAQHAQEWDSFITRALDRGRNRDIPLSRQERLPSGEDRLWEIGCAVSGPFNVNAAGFDPLCR
jgi:hypothetical protein